MRMGSPHERFHGEARVALTPDSVFQLQKLGHDCFVEAGTDEKAGITDDVYRAAGVTVIDPLLPSLA